MKNEELLITFAPFDFSLTTMGFILGTIFTVLKGCNVGIFAHWSWFWCTFPFWIVPAVSVGLVILVLIIALIAMGIMAISDAIINKKNNNPEL